MIQDVRRGGFAKEKIGFVSIQLLTGGLLIAIQMILDFLTINWGGFAEDQAIIRKEKVSQSRSPFANGHSSNLFRFRSPMEQKV